MVVKNSVKWCIIEQSGVGLCGVVQGGMQCYVE